MESAERNASNSPPTAGVHPQHVQKSRIGSIRTHELSTRVAHAAELLNLLELRVCALRSVTPQATLVAEELINILSELVRSETGSCSLDQGLEQLFADLHAEPPLRDLTHRLLREARVVLHPRTPESQRDRISVKEVCADLSEILTWYGRRKMSLYTLSHSEVEGCDALSPLLITHDVVWAGVRGCTVSASAQLVGHVGQSLWFKIFVLHEGRYVAVRPQWRFWVDETDCFVMPAEQRGDCFASIVPLNPGQQSTILDSVRAFIPYAALKLPEGAREVTIEASIYDQRGRKIISQATESVFSWHGVDQRSQGVPSPSALGAWEEDPSSACRFSNARAHEVVRAQGSRVARYVRVVCDLEVRGWLDAELSLECRFLSRAGDLIDAELTNFSDGNGALLGEARLVPNRPISKYYGLEIMVPVVAFALDQGEYQLLGELCLLGVDRRVLAGTLVPLSIAIPSVAELRKISPLEQVGIDSPDAGIVLGGMDIESNYYLNLQSVVRIEPFFSDPEWERSEYRVLVSIEDPANSTLSIIKGLSIGAERGALDRSLVFIFENSMIAATWGAQMGTRLDLRVRVQVYSVDEQLVIEILRPLSVQITGDLNPGFETQRSGTVQIVDLIPTKSLGHAEPELTLIMQLHNRFIESPRCQIYCEFVEAPNHRESIGQRAPEFSTLPGRLISVDLGSGVSHSRGIEGSIQRSVSIQLGAFGVQDRERSRLLKLMLFSTSGRLLQVVYHRVDLRSAQSVLPVQELVQ